MPKPKRRFCLSWWSVSRNGVQLIGQDEVEQPAYSAVQAKLLVYRRFKARFGSEVYVDWIDAIPIGDLPDVPVEAPSRKRRAKSSALPRQPDLFQVSSRARQTFHTKS